ncbi:hypothetical protein DFS34DRAFT_172207 [Phlyctochytrium arcticum]|nr:hypothetical protein DFS34DRAFT_172207 [Phlyctochytrium arcticum]
MGAQRYHLNKVVSCSGVVCLTQGVLLFVAPQKKPHHSIKLCCNHQKKWHPPPQQQGKLKTNTTARQTRTTYGLNSTLPQVQRFVVSLFCSNPFVPVIPTYFVRAAIHDTAAGWLATLGDDGGCPPPPKTFWQTFEMWHIRSRNPRPHPHFFLDTGILLDKKKYAILVPALRFILETLCESCGRRQRSNQKKKKESPEKGSSL